MGAGHHPNPGFRTGRSSPRRPRPQGRRLTHCTPSRSAAMGICGAPRRCRSRRRSASARLLTSAPCSPEIASAGQASLLSPLSMTAMDPCGCCSTHQTRNRSLARKQWPYYLGTESRVGDGEEARLLSLAEARWTCYRRAPSWCFSIFPSREQWWTELTRSRPPGYFSSCCALWKIGRASKLVGLPSMTYTGAEVPAS